MQHSQIKCGNCGESLTLDDLELQAKREPNGRSFIIDYLGSKCCGASPVYLDGSDAEDEMVELKIAEQAEEDKRP